MRHALGLAMRGAGLTTPNPAVGCVIVKDNRIIARGWTQPGGRPHGEFMALDEAGAAARGATVYSTLEPCAHDSVRGPCCAGELIKAGVARVVFAMADPDPRTAGKGKAQLAAAGIAVTENILGQEAAHQVRAFRLRLAGKRPWVTLKLAVTLDGFIAEADGTSKWITGERARDHAHLVRSVQDAILIGRGTALQDNPQLAVRLPGLEPRAPQPIILSSTMSQMPEKTALAKARVVAAPDIGFFLSTLANEGMLAVLVEGGAATAARFIAADCVDEIHLYRAPLLLGQGRHMSAALPAQKLADVHGRWGLHETRTLGADQLTVYLRTRPDQLSG